MIGDNNNKNVEEEKDNDFPEGGCLDRPVYLDAANVRRYALRSPCPDATRNAWFAVQLGKSFVTQPQNLLEITALNLWNSHIFTVQRWKEELKKPFFRIQLQNTYFFPDLITCDLYTNWLYGRKITIPYCIEYLEAENLSTTENITLKYVVDIKFT